MNHIKKEFDWESFALSPYLYKEVKLKENLKLIFKEYFPDHNTNKNNFIFDLCLKNDTLQEVFSKAHKTMTSLRNNNTIKEVYMTLDMENKKNSGESPHGLKHINCQFRITI